MAIDVLVLEKLSKTLSGASGRLLVAAQSNHEVKEAMEMIVEAGVEIDALINMLLEAEESAHDRPVGYRGEKRKTK